MNKNTNTQTKTEHLGVVESWNEQRNFGFITSVDTKKDIYAHASAIQGEGLKSLARGVPVAFTIKNTKKGPQALTVRALRIKNGQVIDDRQVAKA